MIEYLQKMVENIILNSACFSMSYKKDLLMQTNYCILINQIVISIDDKFLKITKKTHLT